MSQRLFALVLVFTLIGSSLAAGHVYVNTGYIAEDHQLVQQHTVFVSLIKEEGEFPPDEEIIELGAVVGLVKECQTTLSKGPFDNAVLWLNDQFLFGNKTHFDERPVEMDTEKMGENPDREHESVEGDEGFVEKNRDDEDRLMERHAGCWIPRGFMHAVQSSGNNGEAVRAVIDADIDDSNDSSPGSHCQYDVSFYVTDPNGNHWVIDRMDCASINGYMYTSHLQVDPSSPHRQGFADRADWAYSDGTVRSGAPYMGPGADTWDECKDANQNGPTFDKCSIEYSFLLSITLDEHSGGRTITHCDGDRSGDDNWALSGESHPHHPSDDEHDCGPEHEHEAYNFDLIFHDRAPHWIEQRPYWDNAHTATTTHGTPPSVEFELDPDDEHGKDTTYVCSIPDDWEDPDAEPYQENNIREREWRYPCDSHADRGFHAHDGTQTPRPT